jgi:diguanylate cyclase (GGDEF)-like protein
MTTDPLTGLPNRDFLMGEITRSVGAAASFALLVLDLDGFKLINDSLGHLTGDQLLKFAAERLRESCTQHMKTYPATRVEPARLGGDEFAVLLVGHGDSEPQQLAGCVIREISKPFHFEGRDVFTGASIGIAFGARSYNTGEEIVRDADTAMYRAKTCGRGRFEIFEATMRARTVARLELETELRHAVARSELEVYYQPKVDLRSGSIIGFEALSRWFHPRRGFIGPSEFIPVAEETGLIIAIGMWALTQGCRQMREWQRVEPLVNKLTLSVNLSPRQFSEPALCDEITRVLEETGYDPRGLCLEITESVLAEDLDRASETLQRLKSMGIGLKLDDFGTGYSSLNYLCRLPFDTLKIDRSFVMRMHDSQEAAGIVKTIVALANDLHMDIVAEGIETPEQYTRLRELGCQYGQGFYFGRPVPPAETTVLIQRLTSCNVLPSVNNGHKSHGD